MPVDDYSGQPLSPRLLERNSEPFIMKLASFISENPGVQRSRVVDFLREAGEVKSSTSVWRYLNMAIESGLVTMQGVTSTARYYPSEDMRIRAIRKEVGSPPTKRARVSYNQDFLESYEPNKTFYLSSARRDMLSRRCPQGSVPVQSILSRDLTLLLTGLPWASSKLEGNGYDLASTQDLILRGIEKAGLPERDRVMITNHYQAIDSLTKNIAYPPEDGHISLRSREIRSLHAILSAGLLRDPTEAGALRSRPINIKDSAYIPTDNRMVIQSSFDKLVAKAAEIDDPYEQSFFLNVHLPYLQPFVDCNKRTARLACNIPLLRSGVMPMTWMDLNEADYISGIIGVYEMNATQLLAEVFTDSYMRSVERFEIMRSECEPDPILVRYRSEVRQAVRDYILNDDESLPVTIAAEDMTAFMDYFIREIESLKNSDGIRVVQFGLRDEDYVQWRQRQESREAARAEAGVVPQRAPSDLFLDHDQMDQTAYEAPRG